MQNCDNCSKPASVTASYLKREHKILHQPSQVSSCTKVPSEFSQNTFEKLKTKLELTSENLSSKIVLKGTMIYAAVKAAAVTATNGLHHDN